MKTTPRLRVMLALAATLILGVLLGAAAGRHPGQFTVIPPAFALTPQGTSEVVFYPVGNQDVRKLVFWDRSTSRIFIYSGGGRYEESWQLTTLGQDLQRR